jgi:hypothetical protein
VGDATQDPGSSWFKIFQNGLVSADYWGTDVINANCGKQDIQIPSDIAAGDYLLRSEVIALHVAGSVGGAQVHTFSCLYMKKEVMLTIGKALRLLLSAEDHWWRQREPLRCVFPRCLQRKFDHSVKAYK